MYFDIYKELDWNRKPCQEGLIFTTQNKIIKGKYNKIGKCGRTPDLQQTQKDQFEQITVGTNLIGRDQLVKQMKHHLMPQTKAKEERQNYQINSF